MNNTINSMKNLNFQAKLDVSCVKGSKQRWQNIARTFEEKTKSSPNDVLLIEGSFKKGLDFNLLDNGLLGFEEAKILPIATTKLKELSDKKIVKNIVDIFKYLKNERADENIVGKIEKVFKLEQLDEKLGTDLSDKFGDFLAEVRSARSIEFKKNHPVFPEDGLYI